MAEPTPTPAPQIAAQGAERPAAHLGVFMTWAGAVMSLSLLLGMSAWGYQLMMRDISGVPVIEAQKTPMRIAPEDPGGRLADHQGLAVNAVAAVGSAAAPADRLVLAPPPVALTDQDQPGPELARLARLAAIAPEPVRVAEDAEAVALLPASTPGTDDPAPEPEPEPEPVPQAARAEPAAPPVETIPASTPGPSRSPRPAPRPATDFAAEAVASVVAAAVSGTEPVDLAAAAVPAGSSLVQLGAYPDTEAARAAWSDLAERFEDYFAEKRRVVQEAESGGRRFYRLRAQGFADIADARRFCAVLVAQGANCIPVVTR